MSSVGTRKSDRRTKGVPPARYRPSMDTPDINEPGMEAPCSLSPPEIADTSVVTLHQVDLPLAAKEREMTTNENELRDIERKFDRKLVEMKDELSRQMVAMQAMLVANNKQLQITLNSLSASSQPQQSLLTQPPQSASSQPQQSLYTQLPQSASSQPQSASSQPQQSLLTQPSQSASSQPQQSLLTQPSQSASSQPQQSLHTQPSQSASSQPQQSLHMHPSQSVPSQPQQFLPMYNPARNQQQQSFLIPPRSISSQLQPPLPLSRESNESILTSPLVQQPLPPFQHYVDLQNQQQSGEQPLCLTGSNMYRNIQKKIYPLPPFSGCPEQWPTFLEALVTTTTEFGYSNLHNIMRLREALSGAARDLVESMLSSSNNVQAIVNILRESFGRPEQLIKGQIEKVRKIPALVDGDLRALVEFANCVSNMSIFLLNANGEHHLMNPSLLSTLVAKLPISKQMEWAKVCSQLKRTATIVDFNNWVSELRKLAYIITDTLPSKVNGEAPNIRRARNITSNQGRQFAGTSVANHRCCICQGECKNLSVCKTFLKFSLEERWEQVKRLRVCFSCLRRGHRVSECHFRKRCNIDGCSRNHNSLLHTTPKQKNEATDSAQQSSKRSETNGKSVSQSDLRQTAYQSWNCHSESNQYNAVLFQVLPVKLFGPKTTITTYAFVDDGANVSILDREIAHELGLKGHKDTLQLQWLNEHSSTAETERVSFGISGVGARDTVYNITDVCTSSTLSLPKQTLNYGQLLASDENDHLIGIPFREYKNVRPKLVLGLSHAQLTVPLQVIRTHEGRGAIAAQTRLGWVVYGPFKSKITQRKTALHMYGTRNVFEEMHDMMEHYFDNESFGIKPLDKPVLSKDNEYALSILKATIKQVGNRYEAGLLWKRNPPVLPESYDMALRRLESVEKKMASNEEYARNYRTKMNDYLEKGYARKLSSDEVARQTAVTFYLPHFGVINPNKSGLRIVFDAAANSNNMSLNKALLSGPDINQPLLSILFKFRQAIVAIHGDIKEMFLQVLIRQEDQDCQRFLWRDGDPSRPVETYSMQRIGKGHYNDTQSRRFEIRNFTSNSRKLENSVSKLAGARQVRIEGNSQVERILGMQWRSKEDTFVFTMDFNRIPDDILRLVRKPTKREMLGFHMSIFDPFGFLAKFMITAKILMQSVWKYGIAWDDPLSDAVYEPWKRWLKELSKLNEFRMPRCYFPAFKHSELELHVFVDASEQAMAVVAYWRAIVAGGANVSFVCAKTSCAPLRYVSIPKLELQAAVMGLRLAQTIMQFHSSTAMRRYFWTDSYTVVRWILSEHRNYKQYVAYRVAEILEHSSVVDWKWCPGAQNPADDATRATFQVRCDCDD